MKFIVEKEWLVDQLENEEARIVDCRFDLSEPEAGERLYREGHISGAFYFDMDRQMSSPVQEHGGRHPLPDLEQFHRDIERAGIDKDKIVVAYDGGDGQFASRFWWLLSYLGHEKVYVLNGGFQGWLEANNPVTTEIPKAQPAQFTVQIQAGMLVSYEEVKKVALGAEKTAVLIDSRDPARYRGETEPIDRKPGHIPGAINKLWTEGMAGDSFKNHEEQKDRFPELEVDESIIVYCGSGVTATPNYLALKMAGYENVKLYAGSYSDWVSYEDNPVAKGEEQR